MNVMLIATIVTGILVFLMWLLAEWTFKEDKRKENENFRIN